LYNNIFNIFPSSREDYRTEYKIKESRQFIESTLLKIFIHLSKFLKITKRQDQYSINIRYRINLLFIHIRQWLVVIFRGRATYRTGSKSDSKPKRSVAWRTAHHVQIAKHYLKRTEMRHGASNNEIIAIREISNLNFCDGEKKTWLKRREQIFWYKNYNKQFTYHCSSTVARVYI